MLWKGLFPMIFIENNSAFSLKYWKRISGKNDLSAFATIPNLGFYDIKGFIQSLKLYKKNAKALNCTKKNNDCKRWKFQEFKLI